MKSRQNLIKKKHEKQIIKTLEKPTKKTDKHTSETEGGHKSLLCGRSLIKQSCRRSYCLVLRLAKPSSANRKENVYSVILASKIT